MNKIITYSFLWVFFTASCWGQSMDQKLADYYYDQGDCEKAVEYLEKVYPHQPTNKNYTHFIACLRLLKKDKKALEVVRNQAELFPHYMPYNVEVGVEYKRQGELKKATKYFENLIGNLQPNSGMIINLQKALTKKGENEWALKALQHGDKLLNGTYPFNIQYATVYGALNKTDKMIKAYIDLLDYNPGMLSTLKVVIPRMIDFEQEENERFILFRNELIRKIQNNPRQSVYSELLIWALVQQENFSAALIQAKGLDQRTKRDGGPVYKIGNYALMNNQFSTAREAFKYILNSGNKTPYYFASQRLLLSTNFQEITSQRNFTHEEVINAINEYQTVLDEMPDNGRKVPIMREKAYIQAYFASQPNKAVATLKQALQLPRYNDEETGKAKLLLGDVYVMVDSVWEASLFYMQVEKKFEYEPLGEKAKYKNACVFYYTGDFKYAQSQLDILKEATTRMIANDAMNLSIFIMDNLGVDSNYTAMNKFAKADLLIKQHQFTTAFNIYDSILISYPNHKLKDDILMRKADAYKVQGKWNLAIELYQKVADNFKDDILADDALFQIAQIYENHLFDKKTASTYYFKIMKMYPGSLFISQARKAYRSIN